MKRVTLCCAALLLAVAAGCQDAPEPLAPEADPGAPLLSQVPDQVSPDRYLVVFRPSVQDVRGTADALASAHGASPGFIYEHALRGFSVEVPAAAAAALARNPQVAYVEPDRLHSISAQALPTGVRRIFAVANANLDIDGSDDFRVDVDVAIIDTGIDFQHPDLNVAGGMDCTGKWFFSASCKSGGDDDHYHGTHVAGTVGALDNDIGVVGVAPGARLWAVKVLNSRGSGYTSWIVAGIDWVAANAGTIEVANMSLGGAGFSQAEYDAIQGAVNKGVAFAVAAGNEDDDANNYSPGGFDNVLSVSALADFDGLPGRLGSPTCRSDVDDTLADFSNWGTEVDIAAPGVCILSTFPLEDGAYGTISGTSMASPHVAGALALLASRSNPNSATDVSALYTQVKATGNFDWADDSGDGTQEPLLDVSDTGTFNPVLVAGSGGGPTPNLAPTADFTVTTAGLTANFTDTSTDSDGTITEWSWTFGVEGTSTAQNPSHTYAAAGTYTVTLTVTDDDGATDAVSKSVTVSADEPPPTSIVLTVTPRVAGKNRFADLAWSGATGANVDIFRSQDGAAFSLLTTTANDGAYSEKLKADGTYTYKVCEVDAGPCSPEASVSFPIPQP